MLSPITTISTINQTCASLSTSLSLAIASRQDLCKANQLPDHYGAHCCTVGVRPLNVGVWWSPPMVSVLQIGLAPRPQQYRSQAPHFVGELQEQVPGSASCDT